MGDIYIFYMINGISGASLYVILYVGNYNI